MDKIGRHDLRILNLFREMRYDTVEVWPNKNKNINKNINLNFILFY